ncbi:hypothetical protein B0H15DRAFT_807916 [Mycena belliarum]|uniref:Uncharacterized protein n=1 Tax=Mycena belliarum TaxID=1033014 RepID=A0AAD6XH83_9AGAR|nr:hypothetical protein B0H15DRAFT_807916 [Mycena belliae]
MASGAKVQPIIFTIGLHQLLTAACSLVRPPHPAPRSSAMLALARPPRSPTVYPLALARDATRLHSFGQRLAERCNSEASDRRPCVPARGTFPPTLMDLRNYAIGGGGVFRAPLDKHLRIRKSLRARGSCRVAAGLAVPRCCGRESVASHSDATHCTKRRDRLLSLSRHWVDHTVSGLARRRRIRLGDIDVLSGLIQFKDASGITYSQILSINEYRICPVEPVDHEHLMWRLGASWNAPNLASKGSDGAGCMDGHRARRPTRLWGLGSRDAPKSEISAYFVQVAQSPACGGLQARSVPDTRLGCRYRRVRKWGWNCAGVTCQRSCTLFVDLAEIIRMDLRGVSAGR